MKKIYINLIDIRCIVHGNWHLDRLYEELRIYSKYADNDDVYLRNVNLQTCTFFPSHAYKREIDIDFETKEESNIYYQQYRMYFDKKIQESPELIISRDNYRQLKREWEIIRVQKPRWVIFCLDDSQPLGKVTLEIKEELSPQDIKDIAREDKRCDRWEKAKKLFNKDHDIFDEFWRSPTDSDFNVDIEKYLDRTEGFIAPKTYTKAEILNHWQYMIDKGEPNYLIIYWLTIHRYQYKILDAEQHFLDVLRRVAAFNYNGYGDDYDRMNEYPMLTKKQLEEILYTLMAGKIVDLSKIANPKPYLPQ